MEKFESEVLKLEYMTDDVFFMSITCPETFTFKAGQYVMFRLFRGEMSKLRAYSILNEPSQKGQLDFAIKIVDGGHASECFKEMKAGDTMEVKGPLGHFVFREASDAKKFVFIGTGTGVAPFYSMVKEWAEKMPDREFHLIFGVRNQAGLFLHDKFHDWAETHKNFCYTPTLTREEWEGKTGRVQTHLTGGLADTDFYICGLKEMVLDVKKHLEEQGVPAERIFFERYN